MWAGSPRRIEIIDNAGTRNVIVITDTTYFNASSPGKAERALGGSMSGTMIGDNQLYVGVVGVGTKIYNAGAAATVAVPTSTNANIVLGPNCYYKGKYYVIDGTTKRKVRQYDGGAASVPVDIIATDTVGKPSTGGKNNLNNIRVFRGQIVLFKPEGIFRPYDAPDNITAATRIDQIVTLETEEHPNNGTWAVEFQGQLFFSVRHMVYQLNVDNEGQSAISVLIPPWPTGRFLSNNYVSGITTNGKELYISYNNIGVVAWNGQSYHPITEFYEQNTTEGLASGLRYVYSLSGVGADSIYTGDGRQLIQLPTPNINAPSLTTQLYLRDQNRSFYWISPEFNANLAEIVKTLNSFSIKASIGGWGGLKLIAAIWQSGNPNYRTIIEQTLDDGIQRDLWQNPGLASYPYVAIKLWNGGSQSTAPAPACWSASDFANQFFTSEKPVTDDQVLRPIQIVSCSFILYGFNNSIGSQYVAANATADPVYINSLYLKYQAVQKYIPYYQHFTVDTTRMMGEGKMNATAIATMYTWLKGLAKKQSPSNLTILDLTGATRTTQVWFQNWSVDYVGATVFAKNGEPVPRVIRFDLMSEVAE
jgi:hypothetical protein